MGLIRKIFFACLWNTLNDIISPNGKMIEEFTKATNTIGKQGKLTKRIEVPEAKGALSTGVESLNSLISDLVLRLLT